MTEYLIATHNEGKFAELQALLRAYGHRAWRFAGALPAENTPDLKTTAVAKAAAVHAAQPEAWVLADDSGLFAHALPERLGAQTARQLPKSHTNAALLALMADQVDRRVTLRSVLALIGPSGRTITARGELAATMAPAARGRQHTGFDRLLIPQGEVMTLAELPEAIRWRYLPRAQALQTLLR